MKWLIFLVVAGCARAPSEVPVVEELVSSPTDAAEGVTRPVEAEAQPEEPVDKPRVRRAVLPASVAAGLGRTLTPRERRRAERWNIPDEDTLDATVLTLARIFVSESGWSSPQDAKAIFQVLRTTRRNDETLMGVMRRHSHVSTLERLPYNRRGRWIVGLNLEEMRPEHFPSQLNWERNYRPKWRAVIRLARGLVAGTVRGRVCDGSVIAWGGIMDDHIAQRRGLTRADCGDTQNHFWRR